MSIQFVLCRWTLLEMRELWMRDEREKKKEEEDKEGEKRRENYYRAGRFLQRRRFHRLFHSEQAFHFRESLFVCPILYNCREDFEVPSRLRKQEEEEQTRNYNFLKHATQNVA